MVLLILIIIMKKGDGNNTATKEPLKYENKFKRKKENLLKETFPPILIPTKRTETYFEVIIAIAILISVIELLSGNIMSGNLESDINIGYPLPMISMSFQGEDDSIFKFGNLVLDLLIYLAIAYMIDITIGLMFQKGEKKKNGHTVKIMKPVKKITDKPMNQNTQKTPINTTSTPMTNEATQNMIQPEQTSPNPSS